MAMADAMMQGKYEISPPHTAQIPKENGEFRTVYVNEPIDRVVLGIANDLLFDLMPGDAAWLLQVLPEGYQLR